MHVTLYMCYIHLIRNPLFYYPSVDFILVVNHPSRRQHVLASCVMALSSVQTVRCRRLEPRLASFVAASSSSSSAAPALLSFPSFHGQSVSIRSVSSGSGSGKSGGGLKTKKSFRQRSSAEFLEVGDESGKGRGRNCCHIFPSLFVPRPLRARCRISLFDPRRLS